MKTFDRHLGERIARQRRAVGLTQMELAEKVGVQPETINRIERGKRTPSLRLLMRLSKALELEVHELVRVQGADGPKSQILERLLCFASRLSLDEIELVMDVGASVVTHTRR